MTPTVPTSRRVPAKSGSRIGAAVKTGGGWVGGMGWPRTRHVLGSVIGTAIGLAFGRPHGGMAGSALSDMAADHSIERLLGSA